MSTALRYGVIMDVVGLILLEISSLKHSDWTIHQNVKSSSGSLKVWLPWYCDDDYIAQCRRRGVDM